MGLYSSNKLGNSNGPGAAGTTSLMMAVIMIGLCARLFAAYVYSPMIAIVLAVAILFAAIGLQRVQLFIVAIFALMPFPITIFGGEASFYLSPSDCIAFLFLLMLPMHLLGSKRLSLGPMMIPLGIFLAIDVTSGFLFFDGMTTVFSLLRIFMMTAVALVVYASSLMNLTLMRRCLWAYLVGINVLTACCFYALVTGGITSAEYTLGIQKNTLGITFGCGIVIAMGFLIFGGKNVQNRTWILATLVGASAGIVLSLSRGSWIATCLGILFLLITARKIRAFLILFMVLVPVVWLVWAKLPSESTEYATNISTDSYNIRTRTESMDKAIKLYQSSPIYGVGIGLRKSMEPHNVIISTLAETGVVGLAGFLLLIAGAFFTFYKAGRECKGNQRATEIVMIGATVFIVSLGHGLMDVYWRRGTPFMAWACVGMCIYIARYARQLANESASRQNAAPAIE